MPIPPLQSQYEAEQGGNNFLARLRNMVSPTSTAGQLGNQDAYAQHIQDSISRGEQPLSRMQFLQLLQQQGQQQTPRSY